MNAKTSPETIKIRNFLVIESADIIIKSFNILIGPQAHGKSIIAKLVSFFNSISKDILESIRLDENKRALDKRILTRFESRFPKYAWEGTDFAISYTADDFTFVLSGNKNAKNKTSLSLSYPKSLTLLINRKKVLFKSRKDKKEKELDRTLGNYGEFLIYNNLIESIIDEYPTLFSNSIFIPASRSFFANLQKNIFTFLATNIDIDPDLKEFGQLYEESKSRYRKQDPFQPLDLPHALYELVDTIVQGRYEHHDEQDWIISKNHKVNLANASSGQQESLPMLLVLSVWPLLMMSNKNDNTQVFIEEPEAHLFPTSQGHIISILSLLYQLFGTRFFITSHSPYILSALNNFILAADCIAEGKITEEEFQKINGPGAPIPFDDVAAYTIADGKTQSIADTEYRMIGGDMLDGLSEHFETVMNKLLNAGEE